MKSDAFATGQTLYALALAGYTAQRPEIKRAVDFLVATQKPDGSWPMTSRSTPDGRPGSSKKPVPITCGRQFLGHPRPDRSRTERALENRSEDALNVEGSFSDILPRVLVLE